jgi:hypothetical protein
VPTTDDGGAGGVVRCTGALQGDAALRPRARTSIVYGVAAKTVSFAEVLVVVRESTSPYAVQRTS